MWFSTLNGYRGKRVMKKRSKRYKAINIDKSIEKKKDLKEIFELVKKNSTCKFDESIDVSLRLNLKQSKGGDFNLRTTVKLPNGSGKKVKLAILCGPDKVEEAKKNGADIVGSDDLLDQISKGKFNFNKLICTPDMMSKIGKLGKILGPKGLMPNPKLGTVTTDVKNTIQEFKKGLVEIKTDKDGNLGSTIGRKSFSSENLLNNFNHLIDAIKKEKPDSLKGEFIKGVYITSTMGISFKAGVKR